MTGRHAATAREPSIGDARLLVVVAHPDDETFGCGSLLLEAARRGFRTTVCCATRGEAGESAPGSGVTRADLPVVRERELRSAAAALGVGEVDLLGYRDSGMDGPAGPGTLVADGLGDVADAVQSVIDRGRPHVVVTLDGADGHRDHARIRDATRQAVDQAGWQVARFYLQCLPRDLLRRWADHMRAVQPDSPYLDVDAAGLGTPAEAVTTVVDVERHLAARRAAIALHGSQVSPFAALPAELERVFLCADHLQRLRPQVAPGEQIETDPFVLRAPRA